MITFNRARRATPAGFKLREDESEKIAGSEVISREAFPQFTEARIARARG